MHARLGERACERREARGERGGASETDARSSHTFLEVEEEVEPIFLQLHHEGARLKRHVLPIS